MIQEPATKVTQERFAFRSEWEEVCKQILSDLQKGNKLSLVTLSGTYKLSNHSIKVIIKKLISDDHNIVEEKSFGQPQVFLLLKS